MAEGGLLSWKTQKVIQNGPVEDYSRLGLSLPPPPDGHVWNKNEATREWKLVPDPSQERIKKMAEEDLGDHDFVEHVILPTDTFQGLCIKYKISDVRLRQTNMFSGRNLKLAPKILIIPVKKKLVEAGKIRLQDKSSSEYKMHAFLAVFPDMMPSEAKYYLDMNDNVIEKALEDAREDLQWERETGKYTTNDISVSQTKVDTAITDSATPVDMKIYKQDTQCYTSKHAKDNSIVNVEQPITLSVDEGVPVETKYALFKKTQSKCIEMTPLLTPLLQSERSF